MAAQLPARAAALLVLVALGLCGCSTSGNLRTSAETGRSIVIYASMEDATRAAVAALEERRLGAGTIENTANGRIVHGELSALAGAVYNSHGGSGKVTIAQDFPGSTKLTISAVTQSRLALERVGAMDALKGYNYNDPQYAEAILETIQQRLRGDTDAQRAAHEKARLAYEADVARKAEEDRRAVERHARARAAASWRCVNTSQCDKAFALAQIYVDQSADMKIQIATNTIVETYNATDDGKLALKAVRIPLRGDEAEVRLTVSCRGAGPTWNQFCRDREVRVYEGYLDFLRGRLQP